ncbi:hypothetical protein [Stutzerimonas nitrititolerans]|uniref:hypothetical protein n=1 Tax=Stutzerimonas nitrititolerans TaxID=2482751 RepID=UPI0028AC2A33|nr:hypothetical protein [Stutzerimonas nitrititolerans]
MSEELKPCSCGSTDTSICYESPQGYWVECGDCGRQTEKSHGRDLAIAAWSLRAHPAEAEGVEAVEFWVLFDATTPEPYIKKMMPEGFLAFFDHEEDAIRAKSFHPGTDYKRVPYVRQSAHLAALSAVTAERDRLRKDAERWRYVSLQGDDTHWLNLLRVDLEDFGGNINAAVDALIDGDTPATAAKEAGPEHVCSGCGAKGWTGNCLECIPY